MATDYDPEDDAHHSEDEDSDIEEKPASVTGREHYESVGKSKLRKPDEPALGARYGGVAVSRKIFEEQDEDEEDPFAPVDDGEEDDDPFAAKGGDMSDSDDASGSDNVENGADIDEDDEIDSDEALGESDVERFKNFTFRGSKSNSRGIVDQDEDESASQESEEEDEEASDQSSDGSEDSNSDVDMEDEDEDEDEEEGSVASSTSSPPPRRPKSTRDSAREELRKAATSSSSTAALASALSAGANDDVKKGQAVKQQQQTFDRLLDARIKLQKGLTVANDLQDSNVLEEDVKAAAQQAEDAALALWSTIDSIRCTLMAAQGASDTKSGQSDLKRKRPLTATRSTSTSELWKQTAALDATTHAMHRATLDKWNTKTQPVIDTAPRSKLLQGSQTHSSRLTEVLDTYLATTTPTLLESSTENNALYDDGPFYQSLLRGLIASRTSGSDSFSAANGDTYLPPKLHTSGSRTKKVDTKASKGRKVRYTVHEKLQDFMAVEDRSTWEDAARREFFASLFGNKGALDEVDDEDAGVDDEGDGVNGKEEVALRLFRN
jgi:protein AATF/BFR2